MPLWEQFMEVVGRITIWTIMAFWLWLAFALVLKKLRIPYATAIAAVLSWVGAGLLARWMLPPVA
jgi:hypothetical protein